jgi:hypothetical protein
MQNIEEFLLFPIALRALSWVLQYIIIVSSKQESRAAEPIAEFGKIEVMAAEVILQSMIQITAINEDGNSIFHKSLLLSSVYNL